MPLLCIKNPLAFQTFVTLWDDTSLDCQFKINHNMAMLMLELIKVVPGTIKFGWHFKMVL
jgi:hypothetical protein